MQLVGTLPPDDRHPYRTGPWQPTLVEHDTSALEVLEGAVPTDLRGLFLRNTENPVHDSIGLYHPFDGDGMLHQVLFEDGRASYRNRFVRTDGFLAEQQAGAPLWTGTLDSPERSVRPDGWGARGRMKDASSTDVVVHRGRALTTFWMCGDVYAADPRTLDPLGKEEWVPAGPGISAHPKVDLRTGELHVFGFGKEAPFLHVGTVGPDGDLRSWRGIDLPHVPFLHDIAFTERFLIVNDFPQFWDPELLAQGVHLPRFFPDLPSRFGLVPRTGGDVLWFEAAPTYVLHFTNAWEEGDEIVLEGYFQHCPDPERRADDSRTMSMFRHIALDRLQPTPHRWRFDLRTGSTREEQLSDRWMEFGTIAAGAAQAPHRFTYAMTAKPGWFLFDGIVKRDAVTGTEVRWAFPEGEFGSETHFAPRLGATSEDDGYLVTLTTHECQVFAAQDLTAGPIARLRLPEPISSGTHATWMPLEVVPSGATG
jgi:carotenoid cleavage dioxygenase-like enzyme